MGAKKDYPHNKTDTAKWTRMVAMEPIQNLSILEENFNPYTAHLNGGLEDDSTPTGSIVVFCFAG